MKTLDTNSFTKEEENIIDQYIFRIRDLEGEVEYWRSEAEHFQRYNFILRHEVKNLKEIIKCDHQMYMGMIESLREFKRLVKEKIDYMV